MYVGEGTARVYAFLMCVCMRIVIRVKFEVRQVNAEYCYLLLFVLRLRCAR